MGQPAVLSAVVTGGVGPFHYVWSGVPAGCSTSNGANLSCQFQASGSFGISVLVTDALGENSSASAGLSIRPAFLGLPASEGYAVLGAIVAVGVGAIGSAALLVRRRRRPPGKPESAD